MGRVPEHLVRTAIALDDVRLLYVPVPKAACTAMLWALAAVAGLSTEDFAKSRKLEVTRELTVHDLAIWSPTRTLVDRSSEEAQRILRSPDWLRVTVVREPMRRIWSAWVSKLLVHDPRFVAAYGGADWFPRLPASSQDVLDSFRRFVDDLSRGEVDERESHWRPQVDLLGMSDVTYSHIGRIEELHATNRILADHMTARGRTWPPLRPANPSILPFAEGVFGACARGALEPWISRDLATFGYEPPARDPDPPDGAWHATVNARLPAIRAVIERNERIADLQRMVAGATVSR